MSDGIQLYSSVVCPFAQRTRILLMFKKIPHDKTEIDLSRDSEPSFLEMNPEGTVPTIVHHGKALYESSIINEYLEEVFPEPRAFPADPFQRAVSRILIDYCNQTFVSSFYDLLTSQEPARDSEMTQDLLEVFRYLNDRLMKWSPDGTYLWDRFGMADLTYAPFFRRLRLNEYYRGFRIPGTAEYRRVLRWKDSLVHHPLVDATSLSDDEYIRAYAGYARRPEPSQARVTH